MRKRLLSILLCLVMVTGLFPTVAGAADQTADGPAAQVGEQKFVRLDEAVKAAKAGDTIILLRDFEELYTSPYDLAGKTLDLNGKTYQLEYTKRFYGNNGTIKNGTISVTVDNEKSLTIGSNDSADYFTADHFTVDGVTLNNGLYIDNGTDVQLKNLTVTTFGGIKSAVWLNNGCSATIEGGSYTIDGDYTSAVYNNGGTLTIKGGTFSASGTDAAAVSNGARDQSITQSSTTTINDGIFATEGSSCVLGNWSDLTINGGSFSGVRDLLSDYFSSANTTINNGFFNFNGSFASGVGEFQINGGYYNQISDGDVSDGHTVILSDAPGYQYQVVKKNNDVSVVNDVTHYDSSKLSADLNEDEQYQLMCMSCSVDALKAAAREVVAQQLSEPEIAELKTQAMDELHGNVYLYVNSYLYFAPISMKDNLLSMEITPMYEIWASTSNNASSWDLQENANGVCRLKAAQPLSIERPVTVSIALPIGFVDGSEKIYIEHQKDGQKYIYDAQLVTHKPATMALSDEPDVVLDAPAISAQSINDQYYLEFTTYHGFSPFAVTQTAPAAKAEGAKFGFDNLQSAADNANGSTVVLYSGDAHKLTLDGTAKAARQTVRNASGDAMTITFNGEIFALPVGETRTFVVAPVTVENGSGSGSGTYIAGKRVDIKADAKDGYTFSEWTAEPSVAFDAAKSAETYFIMPDTAVKVTANYTKNADPVVPDDNSGSSSGGSSSSSSRSHSVSIASTENGTVTANIKNAAPGTTVVLTPTPADGHRLASLAVFDKNGKQIALTLKDGKYTFIMPSSSVEIKAEFTVKQDMLFADVKQGDYFYDAVQWAVENGITNGVSDTLFNSDADCTRAQAVTFLWRAAGAPEPENADSFTDVPKDSYYAKAAAWAVENGIASGVSATEFAPDAICTRAQIVTFLWRAEKAPAVDAESAFTDVESDAYYADAVQWALKNGVTNGTSASAFNPDASCTRAQIVTFLWRTLAA